MVSTVRFFKLSFVLLLAGLTFSASFAEAAKPHKAPVRNPAKATPKKESAADSEAKLANQWSALARQVGQNEKSHVTAMAELRKIKNLDLLLLKALETPQRALALDVIVALKLETLITDLLERSGSDEDGFLVLALNSFLTAAQQDRIMKSYVESLGSERERHQSAASIVAMIEPLGRAERAVPLKTLSNLLTHEYPEVRSSALYYARQLMTGGHHREYFEPAMKTLTGSPYQLRIQALFMIEDLQSHPETRAWIDISDVTRACDKELNMSVKPWCAKILTQHKVVAK